ncbi:MAG: type I 3-dehydroquinate dehydratase [Eubacteriales bacterium]|nr:type I 3-dehydroquinate dehydratase [Eubacteriales bacterium]
MGFFDFFRKKKDNAEMIAAQPALPDHQAEQKDGADTAASAWDVNGSAEEPAVSEAETKKEFIDTNVVDGEAVEIDERKASTSKQQDEKKTGEESDAGADEQTDLEVREVEINTEEKIRAAEDAAANGSAADIAWKEADMSKEKKNRKAAEKDKKEKNGKEKKEAKKGSGKKSAKKEQKSLYEWNRPKKKEQKTEPVRKIPVAVGNTVIGEGLPKICVPVIGTTLEEIAAEAELAVKAAPDLVEWRADFFADILDEEKAGKAVEKLQSILGILPILFTFRTAEEGGNRSIEAGDYRKLLHWAAERPEIAVLDIEGQYAYADAEILVREVQERNKPVIASAHYFTKTPKKGELEAVLDRLERTGADILKLAAMPEKPKDVLRLMAVTAEKNETTACPLITMSMGDMGKISRISGNLTGSALTFGTAGQASAPGQLPVVALRSIVEVV